MGLLKSKGMLNRNYRDNYRGLLFYLRSIMLVWKRLNLKRKINQRLGFLKIIHKRCKYHRIWDIINNKVVVFSNP